MFLNAIINSVEGSIRQYSFQSKSATLESMILCNFANFVACSRKKSLRLYFNEIILLVVLAKGMNQSYFMVRGFHGCFTENVKI